MTFTASTTTIGTFSAKLLPPAYLEALGKISSEFSYLEYRLVVSISRLGQLSPTATGCLVGGEDFRVLVKKLKNLFFQFIKEEKPRATFTGLVKRLNVANRTRNTYLHSVWGLSSDGKVFRLKFVRGLEEDTKQYLVETMTPLQSLEDFCDELARLNLDIEQFFPRLPRIPGGRLTF